MVYFTTNFVHSFPREDIQFHIFFSYNFILFRSLRWLYDVILFAPSFFFGELCPYLCWNKIYSLRLNRVFYHQNWIKCIFLITVERDTSRPQRCWQKISLLVPIETKKLNVMNNNGITACRNVFMKLGGIWREGSDLSASGVGSLGGDLSQRQWFCGRVAWDRVSRDIPDVIKVAHNSMANV